jgi:hypothetical protein
MLFVCRIEVIEKCMQSIAKLSQSSHTYDQVTKSLKCESLQNQESTSEITCKHEVHRSNNRPNTLDFGPLRFFGLKGVVKNVHPSKPTTYPPS